MILELDARPTGKQHKSLQRQVDILERRLSEAKMQTQGWVGGRDSGAARRHAAWQGHLTQRLLAAATAHSKCMLFRHGSCDRPDRGSTCLVRSRVAHLLAGTAA